MSLQMTILSLVKMVESFLTGRKHCGKRRNCSLQAISPFPTVFSKRQTRKNQGLFWKGLNGCINQYCHQLNHQVDYPLTGTN